MKNFVRVVMGCLVLLCVSVVGSVVQADPVAAGTFIKDNAAVLMAVPLLVSQSITPELITDLKLKYGKLKLITVVVEAPVYDIDKMAFSDRVLFKQLGVDFATIVNTELSLEERLKPLDGLKELKDNKDIETWQTVVGDLLNKYQGKILEPGEQYQFLVKRPDRGLIKMLMPLAESRAIDDFADKAVKNLVVGGEVDALDDGIVYMGVVSQLRQMISPEKSFLANA
ncbi:MAG: hypothetical protein A2W90_17995 [Bacteroidetes bacterium GWF2_42_66]|nr:MAG: hypothetical protein A2W92_22255 [Bacteroidetes bacterium GWA2_42_15]OFX98144.1 MAG: hypothetical protein A2W89_09485 [Bacteroidetes bacterium GWE2_42_39]OFY42529.1 MAG: hypothetical protein A2W90_17995 [Bacteroidetes bacterium GWF2_42_66]HBL74245.1 hypothetical protein [Prolixibacteraceae bacterium]HCU64014.1 hypothetical protein [Prolixibacteraceae bacterium]